FIDGGKSKLLDSVTDTIRKEMEPVGIDIIAISWIGAPEYPDNVKRAINAKVEATQKTLQREQEIQQRVAEANMEREQAKGVADAILIKAKAEADAIRLRGEALTENPNVIQLEAINKRNGTLPTTMIPGATTPFVNVK
ncbi:SPFH domain-containing protein, partial [Dyella japonica]|uniref:SPFH domain-containing protein n=1 Tax=Dyella japonica TaxID=231455 RepID=UPI00062DBC18